MVDPHYDETLGGYKTGISEELLKGAPHYSKHEAWDWSSGEGGKTIDEYYKMPSMPFGP